MTFETWKKAIFDSIHEVGFNKTYRKFRLSSAALRNIVNGTKKTGLRSWQRVGEHVEFSDLVDVAPSK